MMLHLANASFLVQPWQPADTPDVRTLVTQCLAEFGEPFRDESSEADLTDIAQTYFAEKGTFLVARTEGGLLVGCVGLLPLERDVAKLRKMYVAAAYRGIGLGSALLRAILNEAGHRGFARVRLETMSRMHEALALYLRYGFVDLPQAAQSPRCDRVLERAITSGPLG
jgi:GNAT superfamily N-acetyltransferase